jgi:hypothetical protein
MEDIIKEKHKTTFIRHGYARENNKSPEYTAWLAMKSRCYNHKNDRYNNYGGRGIKVCEKWLESFENFLADVGFKPTKEHSLDRINVNKDYCKENCKWSTRHEQANNKTTNIKITYNNKTQTLLQWCDELNLHYDTMRSRIFRYNWDVEIAFTKPIGNNKINSKQYELNGEFKTLSEWAKIYDFTYNDLYSRVEIHKKPLSIAILNQVNKRA